MNPVDHLYDSAFWVMFTFMSFVLAMVFQGYWTNWAHRRLDALRSEVDELRKENEQMKKEMKEINERNPFTFIRRAN